MIVMVQFIMILMRVLIEIVILWLFFWLFFWVVGKMEIGSVVCEEMLVVVVMVVVVLCEDGDVNVDIVYVIGFF